MTVDKKDIADDACASINLTLGWRASDPEFDPVTIRYTGRVVLHERAVQEIVSRIERPGIWTPIVPGIAAAGLDVFLRLLDEIDDDVDQGAQLSASDVPRAHHLPGLRERGHSGPPRRSCS